MTDETGTVRVLGPDHPVFNTPNTIDEDTWKGWVQERGLYSLGEKDLQYVDLLSVAEPFPDNKGVKIGALVEVKAGEGRRCWPSPPPQHHRVLRAQMRHHFRASTDFASR